jgi:hypothetical protein
VQVQIESDKKEEKRVVAVERGKMRFDCWPGNHDTHLDMTTPMTFLIGYSCHILFTLLF